MRRTTLPHARRFDEYCCSDLGKNRRRNLSTQRSGSYFGLAVDVDRVDSRGGFAGSAVQRRGGLGSYIKLRGLLTCVYGGALGGLTGVLCRTFKFRSKLFVVLMTLAAVAISYYASWAIHQAVVLWRFNGMSDDVTASATFGWLPHNIYAWATYIHDEGLWAMGKNGGAMSGLGICAVWAVELIMIVGIAWVAKSTYGTAPFCEDCNRWTEETNELAQLPVSPSDPAWQRFADGDLDAVKRLQVVSDSPQYVEMQLAGLSRLPQQRLRLGGWRHTDGGQGRRCYEK